MLRMSWSTFRDRWQVFAGAIVTVCLGVALVQSSLLNLVSAATAEVPAGLPEAQARELSDGFAGAASLLGMAMGLSAFIAIFIVSSTFAFAVAQRRRDLALLRLTGGSRRQVRRLLLGEALLLGTVGSALGVLLGLPAMWLQADMLEGFGFVPPGFTGQWRTWVLAVSIGTGVGIAVLGVLAASRRAARVRPLEALRETGQAARVMTVPRWIVGSLFLAGGFAMLVAGPAVGGEAALGLSMLVSMMLVVAFAALAPLAVPLVSWPLGLIARGQLGQLAYANLRAGVRRSAATAAPVMVLVAFVAGIAGTLATLGEGGERELTNTIESELVVTSEAPIAAELATVDGVATVSEEIPVQFDYQADDGEGGSWYEPAEGMAVDPDTYLRAHRLEVIGGSLADLRGATMAVSPSYATEPDWQVGDEVLVRVDGELTPLRIVALLPSTLVNPPFLFPSELAPAAGPRINFVGLADGVDGAAVGAQLAGLGAVSTTEQWIRHHADEQERANIDIMVALLGLATLYTIIAMVNAVVISASDRRGEFAAARVTGLTRGQVVRMAMWESVTVVTIGLLLGGLAAAGTVFGVVVGIRDMIGVTVLSVPPLLLSALVLGAVAIVGVTTLVTSRSATRTPAVRLVAARE